MSDVIRNAIVKLAIQLAQPNLKLDLSGIIKQQESLEKAQRSQGAATEQQTKANDTLFKSLGSVAKAQEEFLANNRSLAEAQSELAAEERNLAAAVEMEANATAKANSGRMDMAGGSEQLYAANRKLNRSLVEMTEGSLTLGRGFALLGLSQDDNFKKAIQLVAVFQGGADIFKGTLKIVDQLRRANNILAVSQKAVNVEVNATKVASSAASAGLVSLNPLVIGMAAALSAGAIVWKLYSNRVTEAAEAEKRAADAYRDHYTARLEGQRSLDAAQRTNRGIDERIADLAPSDAGKLGRTRSALQQNQQFIDAARSKANAPNIDFSRAFAVAMERGDRDAMGAGAERVIAEGQSSLLATNERLRQLTEDRVGLIQKERDLQVAILQSRQRDLEGRASSMRNKDGSESGEAAELRQKAESIRAAADDIVAASNESMELLLQQMKEQNNRIRQIEVNTGKARNAAYLSGR